jgi:hypothetical protein
MHWPQITYLALTFVSTLIIAVLDHLLERKPQAPVTVLVCAFYIWLLWAGGFFGGACQ